MRLLAHDQRQRQPRLLAAGEVADRRRRHVAAKVEAAEVVAQHLFARRRLEPLQVQQRRRVLAQHVHLMLREIAELEMLRGQAFAASRRQQTRERLQQRRLAGAVGAEQADPRPGEDAPIHVREHRRPPFVAQRDVIEPHELARRRAGGRECELERAVDVRGGDELHAFERLDAALRLLGLGRLGAEAVDERLEMCDLALLLRVRRLLLRERDRALAFELA